MSLVLSIISHLDAIIKSFFVSGNVADFNSMLVVLQRYTTVKSFFVFLAILPYVVCSRLVHKLHFRFVCFESRRTLSVSHIPLNVFYWMNASALGDTCFRFCLSAQIYYMLQSSPPPATPRHPLSPS